MRALRPAAGVEEATSGEIWAHSREVDGAHQLHYDLDEAALRTTGATRSPIASSVFYLETVDNAGAPTLINAASPDEKKGTASAASTRRSGGAGSWTSRWA